MGLFSSKQRFSKQQQSIFKAKLDPHQKAARHAKVK
jgi:hypothetical protein